MLFEKNGGAMTSFGYEIAVRQTGTSAEQTVASLYGAVRNRNAYGANLKWNGNSDLVVEFFEFRDKRLLRPTLNVADRQVSIVLKDGVLDPAAPPGGMFDNLRNRPPSK